MLCSLLSCTVRIYFWVSLRLEEWGGVRYHFFSLKGLLPWYLCFLLSWIYFCKAYSSYFLKEEFEAQLLIYNYSHIIMSLGIIHYNQSCLLPDYISNCSTSHEIVAMNVLENQFFPSQSFMKSASVFIIKSWKTCLLDTSYLLYKISCEEFILEFNFEGPTFYTDKEWEFREKQSRRSNSKNNSKEKILGQPCLYNFVLHAGKHFCSSMRTLSCLGGWNSMCNSRFTCCTLHFLCLWPILIVSLDFLC